jgi:hypothetical protein
LGWGIAISSLIGVKLSKYCRREDKYIKNLRT